MARYRGDSGGQGGAGLLPLADLAVQPAQPEVAVGHERAHAEFFGGDAHATEGDPARCSRYRQRFPSPLTSGGNL